MAADQIEAFLAAIRKLESGSYQGNYNATGKVLENGDYAVGAYQIMLSNWPGWAAEAGIPGANWRDPAAQNKVAKFKMLQYYNRFGSWDLVSIAWFAGPGRAATAQAQGIGTVAGLKDANNFSVGSYVADIREYMGVAAETTPLTPPPPAVEPSVYQPSWVGEMGNLPAGPDEGLGMRTQLTDLLNTISSTVAGGTRTLPSLNQPTIATGVEDALEEGESDGSIT
jgi:hypothetical protein